MWHGIDRLPQKDKLKSSQLGDQVPPAPCHALRHCCSVTAVCVTVNAASNTTSPEHQPVEPSSVPNHARCPDFNCLILELLDSSCATTAEDAMCVRACRESSTHMSPQEHPNGFARSLNQSELRLYLEIAPDGKPMRPFERDEFLLFLKLYDPVKESLSFLGSCFAKLHWKLQDLLPLLNSKAGFPEGTPLEVHCLTTLYHTMLSQLPCLS